MNFIVFSSTFQIHSAYCIKPPTPPAAPSVLRVETLSEPLVNGSEQFARLLRPALVAPEACETHCGAKFPGFGLLLTRDCESALEIGFGLRLIPLGRNECDFSCDPPYVGLAPSFLGFFDRLDGFTDTASSFLYVPEFAVGLG
jgi:hypothetical protein